MKTLKEHLDESVETNEGFLGGSWMYYHDPVAWQMATEGVWQIFLSFIAIMGIGSGMSLYNYTHVDPLPKWTKPFNIFWWIKKLGQGLFKTFEKIEDLHNEVYYARLQRKLEAKEKQMVEKLQNDDEFINWLKTDGRIKTLKPICKRVAKEVGFTIKDVEEKARKLMKDSKISEQDLIEADK
jgi:hypothetical protein